MGDIEDGKAVGREAGQAVGCDTVYEPFAVAETARGAVLTHTEGVAGGRQQADEGVGVAGDGNIGGGPVGGGTLF